MLLVGTFFVVTPVMVSADQDGDYTYTVSNGEATITDYTCAGGAITIPSTLGGYPTVAIGDNAFYPCTFLTSVTIPNSVTIIGNKAFKSCTSLTTVTIGNNVTTIGDSTFYYCSSLASVTIPNNVTTIGDNAFSFCSFLNNVTIGNSVTTIGDNAFSPCSALTSVTIPNNVTTIGDNAFSSCASLNNVTIGNHVKTIGKYAFASCSSLTSVTIPNNVTTIGDNAFSSCASLNNVTIGNHVKTIGKYAFASCSSLTSITFLGLDEPTSVGTDWIKDTPAEIRGHAYAASNFPVPGGMLDFHGLKMGTVISVENIPPRANFTWTPLNPTLNQTVTFDATASNDPDGSLTVYEWDWNNDGVYDVSYTIPTAAYSWTQAGDYPVTLRVTDNGDATSTKTITIPISSGSENNNTNNKGTPGFELVFVLCAIAVSILLWKKKRNV
jgi:hypothetical protein